MVELEPIYNPQEVEPQMRERWEASGAFRSVPDGSPHDRTFTIVIPPPNVTGALHLGHALNNVLQDILIRYHRMRGFNTLWQPGTDHAGIATQAVVEKRIRQEEEKSRHELGREELVRRIWAWKDTYEKRILDQLKRMGCSCDWERTRFTLDEGLTRAVRHQFFHLFKDGLIFRGKRLVNWDTQLQTAVSDDEVYYESVKGHFWHIRYPVIDPLPGEPDHVIIATTRPETMLGDTAVAVHPDPEGFFAGEEAQLQRLIESSTGKERTELQTKLAALTACRNSHLPLLAGLRDMARAGRNVLLPLMNRPIPLITDEWANPMLGSGCVKITPAHDPNDYDVGLRHKLPMFNVLTPDGKVARIVEAGGSVNPNSHEYEGLAFSTEGREKVVADLQAGGFLHEVEDREIELGHSDRSNLPIEPFLSDQWFVQTGDADQSTATRRGVLTPTKADCVVVLGNGSQACGLAQAAMGAVLEGRIQIVPPRYAKTYLDWLGEKRDWCISRQLWWGHRIPVWIGRWASGTFKPSGSFVPLAQLEGTWHEFWRSVGDGTPDQIIFRCCRTEVHDEDEDRTALINAGFVEEEDVLDTWFSSALWPFSTLGWPEQTAHLKQYYPTSVLVTSRDIITNWVARMVMFGLYATGEVPFDRVYITPKVLDGRGETMSKSKGNGVDPVDIIDLYGADALRYSIADMTTQTQDIRMPVDYLCPHCGKLSDQLAALRAEEQSRKSRGWWIERRIQPADCAKVTCTQCGETFATQWSGDEIKKELPVARETSERFEIGRNFTNKLWNAARFAFLNVEGLQCQSLDIAALPPEDRWILARLSQVIRVVHEALDAYQFSATIKELREFFWDSFCDWYVELTKPRFSADVASESAQAAKQVLAFCLDQALRLLHPVIPFVTERLWEHLNEMVPQRVLPGMAPLKCDTDLVVAPFPPESGYPALEDETLLKVFAEIQSVVRAVRDLRAGCKVSPKQQVTVTVVLPEAERPAFEAHAHIVKRMANVGTLMVDPAARRPRNAGSLAIGGLRIFVHDISDDKAERKRTEKALGEAERQIKAKQAKLGNEGFLANAAPEIVEAERARLAQLLQGRENLTRHLEELAE